MVKKSFVLVLALGAMAALGQVHYAAQPVSEMKESASDYVLANHGVDLRALHAGEVEGFEHSQTFAQTGKNAEGQTVLRFATAVKGNIENLSYTRFAIEGATGVQGEEKVTPITTIYKSIQVSDGKSAYYDGSAVVNEASTSTEEWYWACYSITFSTTTYHAQDIKVQLTINEKEKVEERNISYNKAKLTKTLKDYVGDKYSGEYVSLEITDEYTASCTYSGHTVTNAVVTDYSNDYFALENEQGESFKLSFTTNGNAVDVDDIVYLMDSGELSTPSTTYYGNNLLGHLTSFDLEYYYYNSMNDYGYKVEDTNVDMLANDSRMLYLRNLPSGVSVSAESDKDDVVEVISFSTSQVKLSFKKGGDAKITVTVTDAYGVQKTKTVNYHVSAKVFPTEDNWEIQANRSLDDIKVGNQVEFSVNWLDESINTSKEVEWSSSDRKIASINSITGLMEAKAVTEGTETVTITAYVTGENGTIEKSVSFTIAPAPEGTLNDALVGTWSGYDEYSNAFTFVINADGTAVFSNYLISYNFTFDHDNGSEYFFTYNDDTSVELGLYLSNEYLYFYDDAYSGIWSDFYGEYGSGVCMYSEYAEVSKN